MNPIDSLKFPVDDFYSEFYSVPTVHVIHVGGLNFLQGSQYVVCLLIFACLCFLMHITYNLLSYLPQRQA